MRNDHPFKDGVRKPTVTRDHVPLVWECMLGAVFARNPETSEIKYFDFKWQEAREFAQVDKAKDLRITKAKNAYDWAVYAPSDSNTGPRRGQVALWGVFPRRCWVKDKNGKMVYALQPR